MSRRWAPDVGWLSDAQSYALHQIHDEGNGWARFPVGVRARTMTSLERKGLVEWDWSRGAVCVRLTPKGAGVVRHWQTVEDVDRDLAEAEAAAASPGPRKRKRRGRTRHYDDRGKTLCGAGKLSRHPVLKKHRDEVDCKSCLSILERWRTKPETPGAA